MRTLPAIFALLVGAIGWYYLFYSRAVSRLDGIEEQRTNRLRGLLRRINAILMLLIALGIALATYKFEWPGFENEFVVTWSAVMLVLLLVMVLGLIDVRLTWKLRRTLRDRNRPS
jgi:drug/metabolite transporter (DMT)-like permease